jgi:hypothetical protein
MPEYMPLQNLLYIRGLIEAFECLTWKGPDERLYVSTLVVVMCTRVATRGALRWICTKRRPGTLLGGKAPAMTVVHCTHPA